MVFAEAVFELRGEVLLRLNVALANGGRVEEEEVVVVFEVFEARPVAEGEVDFIAVPELEGDDFVAFFAQDADGLKQCCGIVEKVADKDDKATALEALSEGFEHRSEAGVLAGLGFDHRFEHQMQMRANAINRILLKYKLQIKKTKRKRKLKRKIGQKGKL